MRIITARAWLQTSIAVLCKAADSLLLTNTITLCDSEGIKSGKQTKEHYIILHASIYKHTRSSADSLRASQPKVECKGVAEKPVVKVKDWLWIIQLENGSCFTCLWDCPLLSIKLHVMKLKGYFEQVHQLNGDTENITESIVHSNALKGMQLFPKLLMQILTNYFHKIFIYCALFIYIFYFSNFSVIL